MTAITAQMVHPKEDKQYKLRLINGANTVDVGFFNESGSLSGGPLTLDNGTWIVQLFEDNVLKQNYCNIVVAAAAEPAFVNMTLDGSAWNRNYEIGFPGSKPIAGDVVNMPAGTVYGWVWQQAKPSIGATVTIHNPITETGGSISANLSLNAGSTYWLTAITPTAENTGAVVAVYQYYAKCLSDD